MTEIQGTEPDQPAAPGFVARHKALVAAGAAVVVLGAGTTIALTSSSSSTTRAGTNSLPSATGALAAAGDDDVDTYVNFQPYRGAAALPTEDTSPLSSRDYPVTQVSDMSFDVEQTLNIGAQSTGAGAGKIAFNPLDFSMKIDKNTPTLFQLAAAGTPFQTVTVFVQKHGNEAAATALSAATTNKNVNTLVAYVFKLAAIKTIKFAGSGIDVSFDYGGAQVIYYQRNASGAQVGPPVVNGWNRVKNAQDITTDPIAG